MIMLLHPFFKWLRTFGAYWIGVNDLVANISSENGQNHQCQRKYEKSSCIMEYQLICTENFSFKITWADDWWLHRLPLLSQLSISSWTFHLHEVPQKSIVAFSSNGWVWGSAFFSFYHFWFVLEGKWPQVVINPTPTRKIKPVTVALWPTPNYNPIIWYTPSFWQNFLYLFLLMGCLNS